MSATASTVAERRVLADLLPGTWVRDLVLVAGYAYLIGVSAQVVVPLPFTPVPITGQTFAVLLGAAVLGTWRGAAGTALYTAAGLAGVPWFAAAGGATLGYVFGFIAAAILVGWLAERGFDRSPLRTAGAMIAGNLVIYAFGVPYLAAALDLSLPAAIAAGATPFVLGDLLKIALATALVPGAWAVVHAIRRD